MNLLHAVPELFDMSVFYKMADGCRPEEDNDVISCRNVLDSRLFTCSFLMILARTVPQIFHLSVIYKMAECHRPEVENDVISCQKVEGIQIVYILIFGEPTSRHSRII